MNAPQTPTILQLAVTNIAKALLLRSGISMITLEIVDASPLPSCAWMSHLYFRPIFHCRAPEPLDIACESVVSFADRLQDFKINTPLLETMAPFFELPRSSLPCLQSAELIFDGDLLLPPLVPQAVTVFKDAPNLRSFVLRRDCPRWFRRFRPLVLDLPWGQLTTLDFRNIPCLEPSEVMPMLRMCVSLQHLTLELRMSAYFHHGTGPFSLVLPNFLSFEITRSMIFPTFLGLFILPQLKKFRLTVSEDLDHGDMEARVQVNAISPFLRHAASLDTLHLEHEVPQEHLEELLEWVPTLRELYLPYGEALSSSILKHMQRGKLVPKLEALHCVVDVFDLEAFLDIIEA